MPKVIYGQVFLKVKPLTLEFAGRRWNRGHIIMFQRIYDPIPEEFRGDKYAYRLQKRFNEPLSLEHYWVNDQMLDNFVRIGWFEEAAYYDYWH